MIPLVIEDLNRNEYLEALKEYRISSKTTKMGELFKKEQEFYYEKCLYFI